MFVFVGIASKARKVRLIFVGRYVNIFRYIRWSVRMKLASGTSFIADEVEIFYQTFIVLQKVSLLGLPHLLIINVIR